MIALLRRDSTKCDRNCGRNTSRTRGSWRCERSKTLFLLATKSRRRARWPRLLWPRCGDNSDVLKVLPKRYRPITSSKLRHRKSTAASWEFQDLPQVDFHLPKASSVLTIPLARVWSPQRLENRQASLCRSSNCNSGMQVCRRTNQTRLHTNKFWHSKFSEHQANFKNGTKWPPKSPNWTNNENKRPERKKSKSSKNLNKNRKTRRNTSVNKKQWVLSG